MNDPESEKNTPVTLRAILLRTFAVLLCTCILTAITFKLYLNTHHAAKLISKLLTSYLHQPARITSLRMNGGSFSLSGISIGNPPKMPPGNLVDIDSVIVSPSWSDLLMGRQHFRKLALSGLRLNVIKNEAGTWNYSDIVNRFASDLSLIHI